MTILYMKWITRSLIRNNPDKIFLYGDNLLERGMGGQAKECRGEPNTIGIPTKRAPGHKDSDFFTDEDYTTNVRHIENCFNKIPPDSIVVLPEAGLGTGLAQLDRRAPKTFAYILSKIEELKEL